MSVDAEKDTEGAYHDVWVVLWAFGSIILIGQLSGLMGVWDFVLFWFTAAFIALVSQLLQSVRSVQYRKNSKLSMNHLWKVNIIGLIVFSCLGPAALLACVMWFTDFLYRSAKRMLSRETARA